MPLVVPSAEGSAEVRVMVKVEEVSLLWGVESSLDLAAPEGWGACLFIKMRLIFSFSVSTIRLYPDLYCLPLVEFSLFC